MNSTMLKGKRIMEGYTQKSLAEAIGMRTATYSEKERGVNPFSLNEVVAIMRTLNLSAYEADAIFFGFQLTVNERGQKGRIKLVS